MLKHKKLIVVAARSAQSVPDEVFERSRVARVGEQAIRAAILVRLIQPMLLLVIAVMMMAVALIEPAAAQTQGATLGGNSSNPINAFKTALDIGVWVLLGLGIGGIGWGIYNVMFDRAWGRQMVGGACALGFAGIVALVNDVINDTPPALPQY